MCSCDQSLVTLAFLWEKLSQPQFYKDLTRKTAFFEGWSWFKFNNLGLALGTNSKFYNSLAKGLKLKVRKFQGLLLMFVEGTAEKLVGMYFAVECTKIILPYYSRNEHGLYLLHFSKNTLLNPFHTTELYSSFPQIKLKNIQMLFLHFLEYL